MSKIKITNERDSKSKTIKRWKLQQIRKSWRVYLKKYKVKLTIGINNWKFKEITYFEVRRSSEKKINKKTKKL